MRYVLYTLSALFCLATLFVRMAGGSAWMAVGCVLLAGLFLVLGIMRDRATGKITVRDEERSLSAADLDETQRDTIKALLDDGKFGTAVKQIQLWFRETGYETAARVVKELA